VKNYQQGVLILITPLLISQNGKRIVVMIKTKQSVEIINEMNTIFGVFISEAT
jgi:hypothetical protein